jgi:1A family penicillin-binding protein
MYRKGKYTRSRGPVAKTRKFLKRRWVWYKKLPRWKKIAYPAIPVVAFLIITPIATYLYYYNYISDIDKLLNKNNTGIVLLDKDKKAFYSTGNAEHRDLVKLKDIPDNTEHALVAAEDKDFYKHGGFSITGYARAFTSMLSSGSIQGGGSTLTLQVAKNTLLSENQTFLRKYQELTIAVAIEQRYTKDEILEMYLNSVYYGEGAFGIEEAAKTYFDTTPAKLSLAESAMLIGLLPSPSAYSPISGNPQYAKERQEYVLGRMLDDGLITQAKHDEALKEKLRYAKQSSIDSPAPHFTEMVLNQLYDKFGEEVATRSGYQVKTTLDLGLQKAANNAVDNNLAHIEANGGSNASLIAIDPKTGGIQALVGSADYDNEKWGKVNMTSTPRQPGSSFKPIYYTDALARGVVTPATVLHDTRAEKETFGGYDVNNYDRGFRGNVTVRQALDWSLNIPAISVLKKAGGPDRAIEVAKDLGITTLDKDKNYGLSLALGSAEIPVTEMTNAYATFANGGTYNALRSIESIDDKYDNTIFSAQKDQRRAISEQGAYLISDILSDNAARARFFGSALNVIGTDYRVKTVAVKTGTTDDSRDAWTIGYTPNVAIGVWVGNNDNSKMLSGGADMAGPIWREAMSKAIGASDPKFTKPDGIVKRTVCTEMGSTTDVFLATNVPNECQRKDKKDDKEKEDKKPEDTVKCTVAGKENLAANDPNCVEEMCTVEGKENLAANDPNCVEDEVVDSDNDGIIDAEDECPNTPPNTSVNGKGCATGKPPANGPPGSGLGVLNRQTTFTVS